MIAVSIKHSMRSFILYPLNIACRYLDRYACDEPVHIWYLLFIICNTEFCRSGGHIVYVPYDALSRIELVLCVKETQSVMKF